MWHHIKPILQVIALATVMLISTPHSLVLPWNTTKCPRTFYLDYIIIPNFNWVTRILAHTWVKFEVLLWSESTIIAYFVVFSIPCCTKRKPRSGVKSFAYECVLRHANPKSACQIQYDLLATAQDSESVGSEFEPHYSQQVMALLRQP